MTHSLRLLAATAALALGLAGCAKRPVNPIEVASPRTYAYDQELLDVVGALPVQHTGRIKPLSTFAGFELLKLNGKRKVVLPEATGLPTAQDGGEELEPTAWLLDCLLFPEQARHYEVFLVQDNAVLQQAGLRFENRKKRDRYSYDQLAPARQKIFSVAQTASPKDAKDRTSIETQTLALAFNMRAFEALAQMGALVELRVPPGLPEPVAAVVPDGKEPGDRIRASTLLARADRLADAVRELDALEDGERMGAMRAAEPLFLELDRAAAATELAPAFLPPAVDREAVEEWDTPAELISALFEPSDELPREEQIASLAAFEEVLTSRDDQEALLASVRAFSDRVVERAEARGEYDKVPLEVSFYRTNYFWNALAAFLGGILLAALSWAIPRSRVLVGGTWALTLVGTGLVVAGIAMRCVIRGRPPVSTLYETILLITGGMVIVSLFLERATRQRVGLALAPVLGAAGMFLAHKYEFKEAATEGDTMTSLVAVLDTNFWLATHVTTVTLGYAAGLLAAALAHVWLFAWMVGKVRRDPDWGRTLARTVYGVLCFGLLLSIVGTILGGIWANYSWGRFWGWDPKENGALMIVLWELLILHLRLGGYIRDFGMNVMAVLGGAVVAFSWWGVNLLSTGLHSYGFTHGVRETLNAYYGSVLIVTALSLGVWAVRRVRSSAPSVGARG